MVMRTYRPGQVPDNPAQLPGFLRVETAALQRAANTADPFDELQVRAAAPDKLRAGMLAVADGTNWNPGFGAGLYLYIGGAWVSIGPAAPQYARRFMLMGG